MNTKGLRIENLIENEVIFYFIFSLNLSSLGILRVSSTSAHERERMCEKHYER